MIGDVYEVATRACTYKYKWASIKALLFYEPVDNGLRAFCRPLLSLISAFTDTLESGVGTKRILTKVPACVNFYAVPSRTDTGLVFDISAVTIRLVLGFLQVIIPLVEAQNSSGSIGLGVVMRLASDPITPLKGFF